MIDTIGRGVGEVVIATMILIVPIVLIDAGVVVVWVVTMRRGRPEGYLVTE